MARWVALLRGVNVNGITVRSAELAQLFTDMGFSEVSTVLASGNVCFETETEAGQAELKAKIESGLRERFGYDAWIVLVQRRALAGIVENYPFALDEEHHAYVVFTSTEEARSDLLAAAPVGDEFSGEQVSGGGRALSTGAAPRVRAPGLRLRSMWRRAASGRRPPTEISTRSARCCEWTWRDAADGRRVVEDR